MVRTPRRALERAEWNYLPDEIGADWFLVWKTNRFSAAREKHCILEEEEDVLRLFSVFGRIGRPGRTGTNSISFDVLCRWNTTSKMDVDTNFPYKLYRSC